ncbi:GNAT family N-acetyltransferase [Methylobacterium sp. WL30]|jgi:RimJ/RimL family protein N-acetyltransferase|uniref:GNAT family N-acetyltransferase n=1 Tax=unclassified Methylobacterium TaxID=2615210 RepID=UPI0011C7AF8B|nr:MULTISPECIES: GNAT family protein [unclassified Methylobacterium]MCJ2114592.1 GNAT family N-acetyltransferase [Methylobacterium sp. E-025]TXM91809.1 GNAT family N-acetyltransferase [Methylobacterium sp. WL116]TXN34512.1 GNAT family N-acetyltransferase [Methylobacterium sp. WL93]TXN50060.1 GNAT family N-acetyltransferase [Methylobacterium sp. WL119]TXN68580.1 GNAT family N-acetyltransferase [Methylobacterium sp. WL30]
MSARENSFGQPIGPALPDWRPRPLPPREAMQGRTCRVEPLDAERHGADLFSAFSAAPDRRGWTYLGNTLPETEGAYRAELAAMAAGADPLFHAVVDAGTGRAVGIASYLRIDPANGVIEVGHLHFSALLARRPAATEAMALMMARAFDELGYRRYEWKCDALNAPSRAAALRYGFTFEGVFRNAVVVKGRSRDTAWFSVTDAEWPRVRAAFGAWLAPDNFFEDGRQRRSLADLRAG